jgi:SAM-dependent methyltransferase
MMAAQMAEMPRYQLKPGPYSSHTLLLARFPERGAEKRVLDVGCAGGYLAEALAQRGFAVTAIDLPGTPQPRGVRFLAADLDRGLGEVGGPFDFILCADVIEHLRRPAHFLMECRERLAPGGVLAASLPNSGHWYFRANVLLGRFPRHDNGLFDRTHLHFYTWDGWVKLFAEAGFRIESQQPTTVPFGLALPSLDGTPLVGALERVSRDCARLWKRLFAYQFVVTARPEAPR